MKFTEAFSDRVLGQRIIDYVDTCIRRQRDGISHDDKNDVKSTVLLRLLDENRRVAEPGWKTFVSQLVRWVLDEAYRSRGPEINEANLGDAENSDGDARGIYNAESDRFSYQVYTDAMGQVGVTLPVDISPSQWLNLAFKRLCENFRALNEYPAYVYQGDPDTTLPVLDDAATAHLAKAEWAENWFAIWHDIRTHNEPLNLTQIAARVGCDKNTVKKAVERWVLISGEFQQRVVDQWVGCSDQEKAEWLGNTLGAIRRGVLEDIEKVQRSINMWRYRNEI